MIVISLDTETTGVDHWHGAKPFFVTICRDDGQQIFAEWQVDPLTREPIIGPDDVEVIRAEIEAADTIVMQNGKFDVHALKSIGIDNWPWHKTEDTLRAAHILASNHKHDLTSLAYEYLGRDIEPLEKKLEACVKECRTLVRTNNPDWAIAKEGRPDMPSASEKTWKYDCWLPAACYINYDNANPEWETALRDYSNVDSEITLALWSVMKAELERRDLWAIYRECMKTLRIAWQMEEEGVTQSVSRSDEIASHYIEERQRLTAICHEVAAARKYPLVLPKSGNNKSLTEFVFDVLKLPARKYSDKTGAPSLDKSVVGDYLLTLDKDSDGLKFIKALAKKRKLDTFSAYLEGYKRFWIHPAAKEDGELPDWVVLHPSLNPTGTDTLRWSSNNPNEQNIPKQKDEDGRNVRFCFGPADDREWWSIDYDNLELRLTAYKAHEPAMVALFEHPNDPPFYGSYHLLVASILWPKEWARCLKEGLDFKVEYKDTLYQYTKNGNFAVQYGAIASSGTADRAYHQQGAQDIVQSKFTRITAYNNSWIKFADKHGYVETMPDKTVNPRRGYPLLCSRTDSGRILPTVPLNYHIQGTACWLMIKAMNRCQEQLDKWNAKGYSGRITMQVHDELVFDLPKRSDPTKFPRTSNLDKIKILAKLMAQSGDDIGVPTTVSATYHPNNWLKGVDIAV